jgi:hypothetical protein
MRSTTTDSVLLSHDLHAMKIYQAYFFEHRPLGISGLKTRFARPPERRTGLIQALIRLSGLFRNKFLLKIGTYSNFQTLFLLLNLSQGSRKEVR